MMVGKQDNSSRPPFLAFAKDAQDLETLNQFAAVHEWPEGCVMQGDITVATEFLKKNPSPIVLLVELPSAEEAPNLLDALADVCAADTKVITVGSVNEYSFYCWLIELGISSYLLKPLAENVLEGAWNKTQAVTNTVVEKAPGKLIAVIGTRGGVGATAVSLNLSGIFAALTHKQVALLDADPNIGSVALTLDLEPSRGLRDALEKPDRIDSLFIERVMQKPMKNLAILSSEDSLNEVVHVHEDAAQILLKEVRSSFDVVVVDVPRHLTNFERQCLRQADHVVLVTEPTLQGLRDTLRISDMMRDSLKTKPPVVVVNRVGLAPKQEVSLADFEKGINTKVAHTIKFSPDVYMVIGGEIPSVKHKDNTNITPLYNLAAQLIPDAKRKAVAQKKASFTFLKKKR